MKTLTKLAAGGLLAATIFGFAAGTSQAAQANPMQSPATDMSIAGYTRGFDIVNMTPSVMRLTSMDNPGIDDGAPLIGTEVLPGGSVHYEKVVHFLKNETTTLHFTVVKTDPDGHQSLSAFSVNLTIGTLSDGLAVGEAGDTETYRVVNQRSSVVLQMKNREVITVDAGQGQEQANVLNQLCGNANVSCTFTPSSKTAGTAIQRIVAWGANNMSTTRTEVVTTAVNREITESVEISATAKLAVAKVFEVSMSAKYGQTWKVGETITKTHTVLLAPYKYFTMTATVPMQKVTGDFTVALGNTTWKLLGVSFESPDPDRVVGYNTADRDLTAKEKADLPKDVIVSPVHG